MMGTFKRCKSGRVRT